MVAGCSVPLVPLVLVLERQVYSGVGVSWVAAGVVVLAAVSALPVVVAVLVAVEQVVALVAALAAALVVALAAELAVELNAELAAELIAAPALGLVLGPAPTVVVVQLAVAFAVVTVVADGAFVAWPLVLVHVYVPDVPAGFEYPTAAALERAFDG